MTQTAATLAIVMALSSGAVLVSIFAVFLAQRSIRNSAALDEKSGLAATKAIEALQRQYEALALELRDVQKERLEPALPTLPPRRSALNLSRRSQALRMHRLGEPAEKIARELGLSRQELDLLLKVHRIVIAAV